MRNWAYYDYYFDGFSLGVGITSLVHLRLSWQIKLAAAAAYTIIIPYLLFYWGFIVIFVVFGDAL
jgi:hypothetical protein